MNDATVHYSTQDGFPSVVVSGRDRYYRVASPILARIVVRLCRIFHRDRRAGLPSAGRELTFPVSCDRCGSAWDVVRPHGWAGPYTQRRFSARWPRKAHRSVADGPGGEP